MSKLRIEYNDFRFRVLLDGKVRDHGKIGCLDEALAGIIDPSYIYEYVDEEDFVDD